jgi:hypothetical protein
MEIILTGELLIELETDDLNPPIGEALRVAIEDVTALTVVGILTFYLPACLNAKHAACIVGS